ncbi:MAG TPA: SIR2 family protein [Candidatus Bathyarchaeia archaeon]|nr:SIR2 family protein [Candidatus Bathyarchaeia archaeon]
MNQQEIENQIKAIPGNRPVLEELYTLLDAEEAIAFVGAGASAGLWPLWDEFLTGFVEYSLKLGKITQDEADYFKKDASQNPLETAQQLRNKIGDRDYFEYLCETFKDKPSSQTGGAFTLTHKALLQLPIHNYLTLNYDAGLTNARTVLYPQATTSYFFWDQEEARRIRERGYKRLVLHAHGRHDRADSIILTLNDYHKAYDNRAFVRLLNEIFNFEKLILIGFGMTDPYVKQLFNNISKDYKNNPLQHIAFVGLDDKNVQVSGLMRERVEMIYGARVLFYPTEDYHKALTDWLGMLVGKYSKSSTSRTAEETKPLLASPEVKAAIEDNYVHKPTDDENFKGRAEIFTTLNRWANDPGTRTIAVTGIGGQGKTALTGRWLKHQRSENLAQMPVFYWSFYEDLDVGKFLKQVVEFCLPIIRVRGKVEIEPISFVLSVVQQVRLLLVLDGLEVLQEDASSPNHGNIIHPLLNPFLQNWVRMQHKGLMVLTSRFHFPQLARYSGVGYHQLDLVRLSKADGVSLLRKLNILGDDEILEKYVEKLNGHPLALRVLASAVKRGCHGDIAQCKSEQILFEGGEGKLSEKLDHLLSFYESQLKDGQKELLGIISLFKRPIETKSFVTLLGKMKSLKDTPLAKADATTIEQQLNLLIDDFLIEKTDEGITTHPVIRDYFRAGHKITGTRREVADFLKERPGAERPENIEEVRDLVEAVQLLCDEGEFKAANDLCEARLAAGGYEFDVFANLPAISEGLECDLAFVGDEDREQKVAEILGKGTVSYHCAGVSLYNYYLGNLAQAIEWRYKVLDNHQQLQDKHNQSFSLREMSLIEMAMGNIRKAKETVSQALTLSSETRDLEDLCSEFAYEAYYEFLLGNSNQAYQNFGIALCYEQKRKADEQHLYSRIGNMQAEFFIRIQAWKQFEDLYTWNIKICKEESLNNDLALCRLLQGWYEICQEKLSRAGKALAQAEHILRPSGMLQEICRLDWFWALLAEAKEDYHKGLQHVNDALLTCADKGFRLMQAEHFVLRGRLYLLQFQKENRDNLDLVEKAGDDGIEALKIAEQTGYIWAKVDALELLCSYHQARAKLSGFNTEDEKESVRRYEKEAKANKKGLFLTEKQMEEAKAKARKEFEKQTAGWD